MRKELDFPSLPVPLADAILYAEKEIRKAVDEERRSLCLISAAAERQGGGRGGKSDRTAGAAMKILSELPAVVLDDGRTIKKPERWLAVLDEVRELARGCRHPEMIFYEWQSRYEDDILYIGETREQCMPLSTTPGKIISWIRYHVIMRAREKELVSFSDADIENAIEAAAG